LLEARIAELEMLLANEQKENEKAWKEAEDMYVAYDGERKKRNAAEKQFAALQEQLHQVRGGADVPKRPMSWKDRYRCRKVFLVCALVPVGNMKWMAAGRLLPQRQMKQCTRRT
jgi:hypothetical protein